MTGRLFIYDPRVTLGFCILGLLCAIVTLNALAVTGWVAAICGVLWAVSLKASSASPRKPLEQD